MVEFCEEGVGVSFGGDGRGGEGDRGDGLANSASTRSTMKPYSVSSRALKTSAGMMVFLLALVVNSLALWEGVLVW